MDWTARELELIELIEQAEVREAKLRDRVKELRLALGHLAYAVENQEVTNDMLDEAVRLTVLKNGEAPDA